MVCCQAPWRVVVLDGEQQAMDTRLATVDAPPELRARLASGVVTRGNSRLLKQPGGACSLLDRSERACSLHASGGLAALTLACRNFPRSVVELPTGVEIGFTTGCPTVTAMLNAASGPFELVAAAATGYPPRIRVGDELELVRGRSMALADLFSRRAFWWQWLGAVDTTDALATVLATAYRSPTTRVVPDGDGDRGLAAARIRLSTAQLELATSVLATLPSRGHYRAELRRTWRALKPREASDPTWDPSLVQVAARLMAVGVQLAAVHDGRTFAAGLRAAAQRVVLTLDLAHRFAAEFDQPVADTWPDAVMVGSNLVAPT